MPHAEEMRGLLKVVEDRPAGSSGPHTHPVADVTALQASLDGKAASGHGHAIADTTGLQAALDAKQAAGSYITSGGNIGAATGTSLTTTGAQVSSGGGIGYATGAGGTIAQSGSKTGTVILNKLCGTITMVNTSLANATTTAFTLTNSFIAATDFVMVQHASGGTLGAYNFAVAPGAGSAVISVRNVHTASLGEAIVLRFVVIKAVTA